MADCAIRVSGLGKLYHIGARQAPYRTLRETLASTFAAPFRRLAAVLKGRASQSVQEEIWALKDVSFEVKPGEVLGIIGRNGAGKSTLLKILSRITEPTEGRAEVRGRMGSLLEVGTGFHPELSGRDNIYLNGAILGMKRTEIQRKFEEVVAFAEVDKFIDTPVKHYSSGMYMRLAFAVAAHLETEILLVDEVLAVGDAAFQKRCLGKMDDVAKHGRTVLFVSHNMPAVLRLCSRVLLLDAGRKAGEGPASEVAHAYLRSGISTSAAREWPDAARRPGDAVARLCAARVISKDGKVAATFDIRRPIGIQMEFEVLQAGQKLAPNYHLFSDEGACIFVAADVSPAWRNRPKDVGRYVTTAWIPGNFLAEGMVIVGVALSTVNPVTVHFYEQEALVFQVVDSLEGDSARGEYVGSFPGVVRPMLEWQTERADATTGVRP